MKVSAKLKSPKGGPVFDLLGKDMAARKLAFKVALAKTARGLEKDFEDALNMADLGRLGLTWASVVYPQRSGIGSFNARSVVYVRAREVWQLIMESITEGAVIRAAGGKYLAVPTPNNLISVGVPAHKSRDFQNVRVSPRNMIESGAAFVVKRKNGPGLVWMLKVARDSKGPRRGRYVSQTLAMGLRPGATAVPMFTLIPQVIVKARMNKKALVEARFAKVNDLYETEYRRIRGG